MSSSAAPAAHISSHSVPDIRRLPEDALLTRRQVHEISGFSIVTLTQWAKERRGPPIVVVEGRPRYPVRGVRGWLGAA